MTRMRRTIRSAFTLLELLVVISILAIAVAIAVPSFNSLLYTSNQSQAANQLQVALASARDAAVRSAPGADAAAVFFFEPGGRTSIVPCVSIGVLRDADPISLNDRELFVEREVFVPAPGIEPIELPRGWVVRGYAPRESLHDSNLANGRVTGWYDLGDGGAGSDSLHYDINEANWLFPESGFYDVADAAGGRARHTFMVRFEGGTGRQNVTDTQPVLVLAPSPSTRLRANLGGSPLSKYRVDRASDQRRFVRAVLAAPPPAFGPGGGQSDVDPLRTNEKQEILGDVSVDTVLARPLSQVALYNVQRLAGSIGARGVNRDTGSLYLPVEENGPDPYPQLDTSLFTEGLSPVEISARVREWIEDRYPDTVAPEDRVPSDARIFGIRRYDGSVIELTGTKVES